MIDPRRAGPAEDVEFGHVLFVEGQAPQAFDVEVLRGLLDESGVWVERLGSCFHVENAAQALHSYHDNYYFLIDRDHRSKEEAEASWTSFPDPEKNNLLIWRRRHLENYFLDPNYLSKSRYLACSEEELRPRILELASERVYMDATNLVISRLREDLKQKWIEHFDKREEFSTREEALEKLLNRTEFDEKRGADAERLGESNLERLFDERVDAFFGGKAELTYGHGDWLEMIDAKAILPTIVNECFRVKDGKGGPVQGKQAIRGVVKSLLKLDLSDQPNDFRGLYTLMQTQVQKR